MLIVGEFVLNEKYELLYNGDIGGSMIGSKYVEQILDIYNYFSGAIMIDRKGIIEYYYNNRRDINTIADEEVVGKSIFDVYPNISRDNSTLMEVMRTERALINTYQSLTNYKGESYSAMCNTFPVYNENVIVGSIEIFFYESDSDKYLNISLGKTDNNLKLKGIPYILNDIISVSSIMKKLKEQVIKVSHTESTVVIIGETGTGKELIAQAIHANGERKTKRFIAQNCAAIPESILESILFGSVKNGFTDAENRMGLFEAANGGTVFLDEINSMDISIQAKVLRAIEEQKITRVGSIEETSIDVRIIAATNEDLYDCVKQGRMRRDLYYRLNVVELNIPPLRQRRDDIKPLVKHYVDFFNRTMGKDIKGLDENAMNALMNYSWPGNVRELRNILESGFNFVENSFIGIDDLDFDYMDNEDNKTLHNTNGRLKEAMCKFEKDILISTMSQTDSIIESARLLGISRQTLSSKLKEYDINRIG